MLGRRGMELAEAAFGCPAPQLEEGLVANAAEPAPGDLRRGAAEALGSFAGLCAAAAASFTAVLSHLKAAIGYRLYSAMCAMMGMALRCFKCMSKWSTPLTFERF